MSAFLDRRTEDVRVQAIVIAELEFGDIERQIFSADLVETADHPALNQRPEPFDGLRVDSADNIFPARVIDVACCGNSLFRCL